MRRLAMHNLAPHALFLRLALFFGVIFVFLIPPFASPDEPCHLLRATEMAYGYFFAQSELPEAFKRFIDITPGIDFKDAAVREPFLNQLHTLSKAAQQPSPIIQFPYNNAINYTPAAYLYALPFIRLGYALGLEPLHVLYVSRLAIFLSSTFILYHAIRIIPFLKWPMMLLCLFPTTVYMRSSLSGDPLTVAHCYLLLALILRIAFGSSTVSRRDIVLLCVISTLVCLSKSFYLLFPLTFFLIPRQKFKGSRQWFAAMLAVVVIPLLIGTAWAGTLQSMQRDFVPPKASDLHKNMIWDRPQAVDQTTQISGILIDPLSFIETLGRTWILYSLVAIYQMSGSLGLLDILLPVPFSFIMFLLLFFFNDARLGEKKWLAIRQRTLSGSLFFASLIIISVAVYAVWNAIDSNFIGGMQGRYFLPLMPLLLLASAPLKPKAPTTRWISTALILAFGYLCWAVWAVATTYYG